MGQMRWAIVPACLTFGPLFIVMGIPGDGSLLLAGAMMTTAGLGILVHGLFTRQLPSPPPSRDYLSGLVYGIGLGCMSAASFFHNFSDQWLMYVGFAILFAGALLKPSLTTDRTTGAA